MDSQLKLNLGASRRILLLLVLMGVGLLVASLVSLAVIKGGVLVMLTMQDLLAFIAPAVVAMAICYRSPCHAMMLDRAPSWKALAVVIVFYVVSIPMMNWLVVTNQAMTLPAWMSGIEQWMRSAEESAQDLTQQLIATTSLPQLLATVLVVGVLAGVSEELLFRGAMLRMLLGTRLGTHVAVWLVAAVFSAFHMQFYGFVPRLVLGVWLGYLMVWTRSLWVPIIAHALNNSIVVIAGHLEARDVLQQGSIDALGLPAGGSWPWLVLLSTLASIAVAVMASRWLPRQK